MVRIRVRNGTKTPSTIATRLSSRNTDIIMKDFSHIWVYWRGYLGLSQYLLILKYRPECPGSDGGGGVGRGVIPGHGGLAHHGSSTHPQPIEYTAADAMVSTPPAKICTAVG